MIEVHNSPEGDVFPPGLEYTDADVWQLGESGPEGVLNYLQWILDDDERTAIAADRFRFTGVGFHHHSVVQRFDAQGNVIRKLELNFFDEKYPSTNEAKADEGGHAHARDMELFAFYDPTSRQTIREITMLPAGAQPISGVDVIPRDLAILHKVDLQDGLGTIYHPVGLGRRFTTESVVELPTLGRQKYNSRKIHEVKYQGELPGVTVLRQGPAEPAGLNTIEGLVGHKGLTYEEARHVLKFRREIGQPVMASTVLLREPGYDLGKMEERAATVPPERFSEQALGAVRGIERIIRARRAIAA